MRHAVFVVPYRFETSLRFLRRALDLPGVGVSLISQDSVERFDQGVQKRLIGFRQIRDGLNAEQIVGAVRELSRENGPADCLIGVLEQLQVPLAAAREQLGLPGLSVEAARNFRDKSRMKDVLRIHDLPCARHRLVTSSADAFSFAEGVGLPVIVKPPAGAGAVNTFRIDRIEQLHKALGAYPPNADRPVLLEEFVVGEEHSYDAVCVEGRVVWYSISRYAPPPLEVMENDWIQWSVLLPRRIDGPEYEPIRKIGAAALKALGMGTGLCHMEWFRRQDGSVALSEVGARPPGAQFTSLMSWAHDADLYQAWARLMIQGDFTPPERRYAVGAAYLRGQGHGRVKTIHGLDVAQRELGDLVVEVKLPEKGQSKSKSYEGEGYVILRHSDTEVVEQALMRLVAMVRVEME